MSNNIHPKLQAAIDNMSDEQIAEILNTKYTAADIAKQQKALEQLKEQLCNPKQVTIEGWVLRDDNNKIGIYRDRPTCDEDGWDLTGERYELFPDITSVTEPKRYRITITPID